jgi:predicted alternative tryptophan synthase beta-subunit
MMTKSQLQEHEMPRSWYNLPPICPIPCRRPWAGTDNRSSPNSSPRFSP